MFYSSFFEKFPEIAQKETRRLIVFDDPELPKGAYAFVEAFCEEAFCDCRRVFFYVMNEQNNKLEAVIAYGWESKKFYEKWMGEEDPFMIQELKGPVLNLGSPQSNLAPIFLKKVSGLLSDKEYVERIKKHYQLYKDAVDAKEARKQKTEREEKIASKKEKVGRNQICPCGSKKKYKNCCGK